MSNIIADSSTVNLLQKATEISEVRDNSGALIGVFTPAALLGSGGKKNQTIPRKLYSTVEVFEHLLSLTQDEHLRKNLHSHIAEIRKRDECAAP